MGLKIFSEQVELKVWEEPTVRKDFIPIFNAVGTTGAVGVTLLDFGRSVKGALTNYVDKFGLFLTTYPPPRTFST